MRKPIGKIRSEKIARRVRKKLSLRSRMSGSPETPRVVVSKTNRHLHASVVDDTIGKTLFSLGTFGKNKPEGAAKTKDGARNLGKAVGERMQGDGLSRAVFDRNGFPYHGLVKEIAEGLREKGINV